MTSQGVGRLAHFVVCYGVPNCAAVCHSVPQCATVCRDVHNCIMTVFNTFQQFVLNPSRVVLSQISAVSYCRNIRLAVGIYQGNLLIFIIAEGRAGENWKINQQKLPLIGGRASNIILWKADRIPIAMDRSIPVSEKVSWARN